MQKKKEKVYKELTALKGLIRERGTSYEKLANELGMATATLSNKINGFTYFNAIEIDRICEILDIDAQDVVKYFFPHLLSNYIKNAQHSKC